MTTVMPVSKAVYLCDEVVEDKTSQKVHLLGLFNAVRPPASSHYPFRLGQLCVFAQMIGGVGVLPVHVEVVNAQTEEVIYAFPKQDLRFAMLKLRSQLAFEFATASSRRPEFMS